jgi:hypothetical protein
MLPVVRVEADELEQTAAEVIGRGRPYKGDDMLGARLDAGYGLAAEGFTVPTITETSDPQRMVLYLARSHD